MSNRKVAILLAFFGGFVGLHKYFMKKIVQGVIFSTFSFTMIPMLLSLLDVLRYAMMSDEEFDHKYNMGKRTTPVNEPKETKRRVYKKERDIKYLRKTKEIERLKQKGKSLYKNGRYEEATKIFEKALALDPNDAAINFNLACCHAKETHVYEAFVRLSKAIEVNKEAKERSLVHPDLTPIRDHEYWQSFLSNGCQVFEKDFPFQRESLLDQLVQESNKRKNSKVVVDQKTTKTKEEGNDYTEIFE